MGNELFGIDIAGIIADAVGSGLLDVVVTRYTAGARDPNNMSGGRARTAETVEGIKGFFEDFTGLPRPGFEVELGDRKAVLIGDTIPPGGEPRRNDAITIEGVTLYAVQLYSRDPAAAVYVFQCRDRRGQDGV
jgi:hypothetical protein